jgi:dihydroorotase
VSKVDKVFKNGKIVTPHSVFRGGIAVKDGKIVAIGADAAMPRARDGCYARAPTNALL